MTCRTAFAVQARLAKRAGAVSRALEAMSIVAIAATRTHRVVLTHARSPGPGRP